MIPKVPDGFNAFTQPRERGLLLRSKLFLLQKLRDSVDPIFEMPFIDFGELIRRQVIFQKYKHEIIQRAKIDEKKPYRGRPIQSLCEYRDGIHVRLLGGRMLQ
jgi:hypothetical protein